MLEKGKELGSGRFAHLDLLRLIACFLVVFNHTQGCIKLYEYGSGAVTVLSFARLFIAMTVKINVPVFYMITGSLLLNRDRGYREIFGRISKMFSILLIFSIVSHALYKGEFYFPGFIRNFASATVDGAGPYWYLYSYLGILLILPFLRSIAARMNTRDVSYLIGARLVIGAVIPMLYLIVNRIIDSNMYVAESFQPAMIIVDCVFYPLVGYGIDRCLEEKETLNYNRIFLAFLFVTADILGVVAMLISGNGESFDGFVFVMVMSFFGFIKKSVSKSSHRADGIISALGALTFGIYLLDPIIGPFCKKLFDFKGDYKMFWSSIVYCLFSMIVGGSLTFVFKGFKKKFFQK